MATEIERKFLVTGTDWQQGHQGTLYRQGYLCTDKKRTVRVRVAGEQGFLTVKGKTRGISRLEFEYPIPVADADAMLNTLCEGTIIEKIRYRIPHKGHLWEVDIFLGANKGLILAEIELVSERQAFDKPVWIGREVSGDCRFYNSFLSRNPYACWPDEEKRSLEGE
jgi:CYTH domain-containing protein